MHSHVRIIQQITVWTANSFWSRSKSLQMAADSLSYLPISGWLVNDSISPEIKPLHVTVVVIPFR